MSETMFIDPVCGMRVDPARAAARREHAGRTWNFCSVSCAQRFEREPERYLAREGESAPPCCAGERAAPPVPGPVPDEDRARDARVFTCPMHPEVRQVGPGSCPLCGMALEPLVASADDGPDPELIDFRRRLWLAIALSAPVLALAMGDMLPSRPVSRLLGETLARPLELVLASAVVLGCGWPLLVRAWRSLFPPRPNMFTLIGLGTLAAWLHGLVAVLAPGLFPAGFRDHAGRVPVYLEAAAVIVTLVLAGQVLELVARKRTGSAIRELLDLAPKRARRILSDGREEDVPLEALRAGDRLRVRPGEKVPADGVVLEGRSTLDESLLTGEPMPLDKGPGERVTGGTLNGAGALVIEAERVGSETVLARIVALVAEAQRTRAPLQRLADRVAAFFVPAVVLVALATFAVWAVVGPEPRLAHALLNAVAVLIIACPCALGLATPMSIMVAMGRGARSGLLFRDAEALERLREVDTLVLDKTGTLTAGRPRLVALEVAPGGAGFDERELLRLVASLERASEHPLAAALVAGAEERGLQLSEPADFEALPGLGVRGRVGERRVTLGNAALLQREGLAAAALAARAEELRSEGATVMLAAVDGVLAGLVAVADPIRPTTLAAVRALRAEGLELVMLTGDARRTAEAVAHRLGLDRVQAEVLPADKERVVRRLQEAGKRVGMVGDGVNDAPALARADVGIAMGGGADVAIESAGLTLIRPDLAGLLRARRLSRATVANIHQNLFFAFLYNALGVPLAAGVLYPWSGFLLSPMFAAAAMSLSSVSVIANALRLRGAKL